MAKRLIPEKYKDCDFGGWATRNDIRCSDGRTIRRNAFAHQDGAKVPLVWGHQHDSPQAVLGHGFLENDPEGVFFYGYFNDSEDAQRAKHEVAHGDITSLSIWANHLKEKAGDVLHGSIKEVSLVLSGANLGAQITYPVIMHGDNPEQVMDEAYITFGDEYSFIIQHDDMESRNDGDETIDESSEFTTRSISHMDDIQEVLGTMNQEQLNCVSYLVGRAAEENELSHADTDEGEETVQDVLDTMTPKQRKVVAYLVSEAAANGLEHADMDEDDSDEAEDSDADEWETFEPGDPGFEEDEDGDDDEDDEDLEHYDYGGNQMNFNAFDSGMTAPANFISHSDQKDILDVAKKYGSLKDALAAYAEEHGGALSHDDLAPVSGFGSYPENGNPAVVDALFPEFHNMRTGEPELVTNDLAWVKATLSKVNRIPYSRIRTSQVDIRELEGLRAKGYQKGKKKILADGYPRAKRETVPQTVYVRSTLNNDDIIDITDFSYVDFQYKIDRMGLEGEIARCIFIPDGRELSDPDKVFEDKIRPIWTDDDIFVIHKVLSPNTNMNGTNTQANFGASYLYANAVEELLLDAKIDYRGSGSMDMFTTQRFWNKLILAKDMNGRRLYNTKAELMNVLDVNNVYNVPEFDGKTRTVNGHTYRLLALVGNLRDYTIGSTKGGEIVHRSQFDIDFNQHKSLLETRLCGALTRIQSFIAIEEEVTGNNANPSQG